MQTDIHNDITLKTCVYVFSSVVRSWSLSILYEQQSRFSGSTSNLCSAEERFESRLGH